MHSPVDIFAINLRFEVRHLKYFVHVGQFASLEALCGSNQRGPQRPKPTTFSLPFDIIDSDRTVCFWLLPLLHDSRLRTCFPRYDKQHDASNACNDADIMHTCRWYGTKRQDMFSNVTIMIELDVRGKARRRVRILVETKGKASILRFLDTGYTKE